MAIDKSVHTILYQKAIARLRSKREERGLTQKQLAGMLGASAILCEQDRNL